MENIFSPAFINRKKILFIVVPVLCGKFGYGIEVNAYHSKSDRVIFTKMLTPRSTRGKSKGDIRISLINKAKKILDKENS